MLDEALTTTIGGVRLTCEEELYGVLGVVDDTLQTLEVGEEEVRTLVGSEATTEADDQSVGVDTFEDGYRRLGVAAVADPLLAVEGADMLDETELDSLVRLPDGLVGELLDLRPGSFLGLLLDEVLAEVLRVELLPLSRGPRRQVDAVGDVADVQLFGEEALPDGGEHLLRDTTVQQAHAVGFLTGIQCEDAHRELLVALGILTAEADEVMPRDAETPRDVAEVLAEELLVEVVVTSGDGRVTGVDRGGADELESFVEGKTFALDVVQEALYAHEGSVTFVHVVDVLRDAEAVEEEHTTDTEEVLLLHTVLPVTAIELVCDGAVPFAILWDVSVEEVEADTADVHLPYMAVYGVTSIGHLEDEGRLSVLFEDLLDGKLGEVLSFVVRLLLAFGAEALGEVAVAIEEADGGEADVAVTGFLEVVTGEDAKTAGIDLEDIRQTVLHAEVGDGGAYCVCRLVYVGLEVGIDFVQLRHEVLVCDEGCHLLGGEQASERDRIAFGRLPEFGRDTAEEILCLGGPYPPEVVGDLVESTQLSGQLGISIDVRPDGIVGALCYDHKYIPSSKQSRQSVDYPFLMVQRY